MAKYETEWKSWHVRTVKDETKFVEDTFETANGKTIKFFRDENSPYFQCCLTTNQEVLTDNIFENKSYHEELKFLTTQLNKMELYWNIKIGQKQEQLENHLGEVYKQEQDKYWNALSVWQKICNYNQYNHQVTKKFAPKEHKKASVELESMCEQKNNATVALRQEVEIFKANSREHRNAFARSGLRKNDFEALKKAREAYAKE